MLFTSTGEHKRPPECYKRLVTYSRKEAFMNSARALCCLLLAMTTVAFARGNTAPTSSRYVATQNEGAGEREIARLVRQIADAVIGRDAERMGLFLAEDFALIAPDGQYLTRAAVIDSIKSAEYVAVSIEFSDMRVRVYGDTAIATYVGNERSTYKGKDVSGRSRTTDIFVRRAGKWQQVGGQSTAIEVQK